MSAPNSRVTWISGCPTGKRGYLSRADAKKSRAQHASRSGMNCYACTLCSNWHIGHLPTVVVQGDKPRSEIYPPLGSLPSTLSSTLSQSEKDNQ